MDAKFLSQRVETMQAEEREREELNAFLQSNLPPQIFATLSKDNKLADKLDLEALTFSMLSALMGRKCWDAYWAHYKRTIERRVEGFLGAVEKEEKRPAPPPGIV